MAFGIKKKELKEWKEKIKRGEIAFITHYWLDERFPNCKTVTKVGCQNIEYLAEWGAKYGLKKEWIHIRENGFSHYDLLGDKQKEILEQEGILHQLNL